MRQRVTVALLSDKEASGFERRTSRADRRAAASICRIFLGLAVLFGSADRLPGQATQAQTNVVQAAGQSPSGRLSASYPMKLSPWQEKLTLGPGDVFSISIYGEPASTVPDMFVGPDGRINYLEARDVMAADRSVDELRDELEKTLTLSKAHLTPRVIINPVVYKSKKYFVLGNVAAKGVYVLDKPTTIIEAVAKAKGFVTTPENRAIHTLVNYGHSFLIRKNPDGTFVKMPVDFENLFLNGDLAQNHQLAPDDYLYFPPLELQDVYVLGEVGLPGVAIYTKGMTAMQAVAKRGDLTDAAFRRRVLVIRGSLNRPETFVINSADVLSAKARDFALEAGDIIYVSRKPWAKAEELLDLAVRGFVQAAVITWTGNSVGPLIK